MRIDKNIIKIRSRVRLTEDLDMFDCKYTKGHEFNVVGQSQRGWDLIDDDGHRVSETWFINHTLEVVKKRDNG